MQAIIFIIMWLILLVLCVSGIFQIFGVNPKNRGITLFIGLIIVVLGLGAFRTHYPQEFARFHNIAAQVVAGINTQMWLWAGDGALAVAELSKKPTEAELSQLPQLSKQCAATVSAWIPLNANGEYQPEFCNEKCHYQVTALSEQSIDEAGNPQINVTASHTGKQCLTQQ